MTHRELFKAIECNKPFGYGAVPWNTWGSLYELEQRTGSPQAASEARKKAIQSYLGYRRSGGESLYPGGKICAIVEQTIREDNIDKAEKGFAMFLETDKESPLKILGVKLLAVFDGERDPALVEDPRLDYDDAVELQLLLERLAKEPPVGERGIRGLIRRLGRKKG